MQTTSSSSSSEPLPTTICKYESLWGSIVLFALEGHLEVLQWARMGTKSRAGVEQCVKMQLMEAI